MTSDELRRITLASLSRCLVPRSDVLKRRSFVLGQYLAEHVLQDDIMQLTQLVSLCRRRGVDDKALLRAVRGGGGRAARRRGLLALGGWVAGGGRRFVSLFFFRFSFWPCGLVFCFLFLVWLCVLSFTVFPPLLCFVVLRLGRLKPALEDANATSPSRTRTSETRTWRQSHDA